MKKRKTATLLKDEDDLRIVLNRLTFKRFNELKKETGEIDYRDDLSSFRFSCAEITKEIGGCRRNVIDTILSSSFDYFYSGSFLLVLIDDLNEKLEMFFIKHS